jgi:hypothetical protein
MSFFNFQAGSWWKSQSQVSTGMVLRSVTAAPELFLKNQITVSTTSLLCEKLQGQAICIWASHPCDSDPQSCAKQEGFTHCCLHNWGCQKGPLGERVMYVEKFLTGPLSSLNIHGSLSRDQMYEVSDTGIHVSSQKGLILLNSRVVSSSKWQTHTNKRGKDQ